MSRSVVIWVLLFSATFACGGGSSDAGAKAPMSDEEARSLCDREAAKSSPRGPLVAAFATTVDAVKEEHQSLYGKPSPELKQRSGREPLALCYYDVPPGLPQPPGVQIERVSAVVDSELNSFFLHGGSKASVDAKAID